MHQENAEVSVTLLFFAKSKELVGKKEELFVIESTVRAKELLRNIIKLHPRCVEI